MNCRGRRSCGFPRPWAALRFQKLGIYGIYLVFATNLLRMLLFERDHLALRLGVTLGLGLVFGLVCARVWKEFR